MTQSEKLQKVIERAVKNGWKPEHIGIYKVIFPIEDYFDKDNDYGLNEDNIIFEHDFAKAYWKEAPEWDECEGEKAESYSRSTCVIEGWQYQLQQLALTPPSERIDYLFSFIENERKND